VALILIAVLGVAATPAAAQEAVQQAAQQTGQQAPGSGVTAEQASATQVGALSAPLPGPRLSPEFPRVEPAIAERGAAARPVPPAQNTIVISTLALVLIVIIITILVVN
jgi:hypothetical protein